MVLRPRWYGALILVAALALLAACGGGSSSRAVNGAAATAGPVTITTNFATYTTGDAVGVTVMNASKADYYAKDGASACTIVQLERYNTGSGVWDKVDACNGSQQVQVYVIAQGSAVPYTLAPTSPSDVNSWEAGTYRIAVSYSTASDGATQVEEAHSAAFTIKG
ncbi:MAG: hypothetical protein KGO05_12420 [Chloroflexota bacterium]|nr:hypothetical protein [Chloroflexota bacterium]